MKEFLLCLFGGAFGLHKFYRGKIGAGILYLLTVGLIGIGWMVDTFRLGWYLITGVDVDEKERQKEEAKQLRKEQQKIALQEKQERIDQLDKEGIAYCPNCTSTSLQYVERRKRLSVGRAVAGTVLLNPMWGAVGAVTSKKYKGYIKCLKCGNVWKA